MATAGPTPVPAEPLPLPEVPVEVGTIPIHDYYAQAILLRHQALLNEEANRRGGDRPTPEPVPKPAGQPAKVGIIGAGVAGLYAAYMFDFLNDPDFTYEILEASAERVGGRLYTHHFNKSAANEYFVSMMSSKP
jgi:hypothetical protein